MADEIPPKTADDEGQTVRIPPSSESDESFEKTAPLNEEVDPTGSSEKPLPYSPTSKGQTVRIHIPVSEPSLKREAMGTAAPQPSFPKKETTNLQTSQPSEDKPILPPPPISKPMAPGIPKPPVVGAKPAVPSAPVAAPISPKKETARIQIPPQPKTPLHKATVKLEQPKPASVAPAASIAVASTSTQPADGKDSGLTLLSWILAAISLVAAAISFAVFHSATL